MVRLQAVVYLTIILCDLESVNRHLGFSLQQAGKKWIDVNKIFH